MKVTLLLGVMNLALSAAWVWQGSAFTGALCGACGGWCCALAFAMWMDA